jgi:REP-associated tyrosine transposase
MQFEVALLDYCLRSNHVHLSVDAEEKEEVEGLMREVAGEFGKAYNTRKGRSGGYWGDNYHATLVEDGKYFWRCLVYIELNMVRCGVVKHPRDWEWVGYQEIMGGRSRYRLLDLERLCWRLRTEDMEELRKNLEFCLAERIAKDEMEREPRWTESLAVGSSSFVERIQPMILTRRQTRIEEAEEDMWVLKEEPIAYGQRTGPKIGCKASK